MICLGVCCDTTCWTITKQFSAFKSMFWDQLPSLYPTLAFKCIEFGFYSLTLV